MAGWIGIGILVFLVIGIIGTIAGGNDASNAPTAGNNTVAEQPVATEPGTTSAPGTTPPTTARPRPKRWVTVIAVGGASDKRTDVFTLHGGKTRLTYTFTDTSGFGSIVGAIYVLDEGDSLAKSGGIPEVTVSEPGSDSTFLAQGAGRYYLDVSAANARWTVKIQEYR